MIHPASFIAVLEVAASRAFHDRFVLVGDVKMGADRTSDDFPLGRFVLFTFAPQFQKYPGSQYTQKKEHYV